MAKITYRIALVCSSIYLIAVLNILWFTTVKATDNIAIADNTSLQAPVSQPFSSICCNIYEQFETNICMPKIDVFEKALKGHFQLKNKGLLSKDHLLTVIDFRLSSNEKRLWIFDLEQKKVLFHTWVAHGRNSGEEFATAFSNTLESFQSSLGFYVTGAMYEGKHGLSLILDGQEKGFNTNARERAVVMHGADYVSEQFMATYGRLGRSYGCPAIARELQQEIIPLIADKSCLFIYYPDAVYEAKSSLLNIDESLINNKIACVDDNSIEVVSQ